MSKIKELDSAELDRLRGKVREKFKARCPGEALKETTFKGAYDDLRADILRAVPDVEFSVSTQRLRKLFYYTNPAVCAAAQLESPSFGRDFLDAIERYVGEEARGKSDVKPPASTPLAPPTRPERRLATWVLALAGVLLCLTWLANWLQPAKSKGWREDFGDVSLEGLRKNGWDVLDYDSAWFSKQPKDTGALTLYTLHGDYWVKPNEKPKIPNLLYKKIDCECCLITVKINGFQPNQDHQQASLFLLESEKNRQRNIRFGVGCSHCSSHLDKTNAPWRMAVFQNRKGNVVPSSMVVYSNYFMDDASIYLFMEIKNGKVNYLYKEGKAWTPFERHLPETSIDYLPEFIAISAFHGFTWEDGTPKIAEAIPVYYDFVEVKPCQ